MSEVCETEEALTELLEQMNESGVNPLLPAYDRNGVPFLASLGDCGDTTELVFIGQGDDGWPACYHPDCHECSGDDGARTWRPVYPIEIWRQP